MTVVVVVCGIGWAALAMVPWIAKEGVEGLRAESEADG